MSQCNNDRTSRSIFYLIYIVTFFHFTHLYYYLNIFPLSFLKGTNVRSLVHIILSATRSLLEISRYRHNLCFLNSFMLFQNKEFILLCPYSFSSFFFCHFNNTVINILVIIYSIDIYSVPTLCQALF